MIHSKTLLLFLAILLVAGCTGKPKIIAIPVKDTIAKIDKPKRDPLEKIKFYLDIMSNANDADIDALKEYNRYAQGESTYSKYLKKRRIYDSVWKIYDSARIDLTKPNSK